MCWLARLVGYDRRGANRGSLCHRGCRLPNTGRCEQSAQSGCFDFLVKTLLVGIDCRYGCRRRVLRVQYRTSEIARQWWPEWRRLAGYAGVITRQARQTVSNVVMIGRVEL